MHARSSCRHLLILPTWIHCLFCAPKLSMEWMIGYTSKQFCASLFITPHISMASKLWEVSGGQYSVARMRKVLLKFFTSFLARLNWRCFQAKIHAAAFISVRRKVLASLQLVSCRTFWRYNLQNFRRHRKFPRSRVDIVKKSKKVDQPSIHSFTSYFRVWKAAGATAWALPLF